ncbi:MAG: histidine phosphatase family protein [Pseudomonadota bacterium]
MTKLDILATTVAAVCVAGSVWAQGKTEGRIDQVSTHMGEMIVTMETEADAKTERDTVRFEPWQMADDLLNRDDIVFLMRHGPTDWSKRDIVDVSPTDCDNQRIMTDTGKQDMENFGILLAANDVRPGKIVVSEWCRNQQTLSAFLDGMRLVNPDYVEDLSIETSADLNLLLSLQGAPTVTAMREMISTWTGEGHDGPLLLISHFTNIDELTEFHVYEGELLVLDPKRENRVLGYVRLKSASPDVGHFSVD